MAAVLRLAAQLKQEMRCLCPRAWDTNGIRPKNVSSAQRWSRARDREEGGEEAHAPRCGRKEEKKCGPIDSFGPESLLVVDITELHPALRLISGMLPSGCWLSFLVDLARRVVFAWIDL